MDARTLGRYSEPRFFLDGVPAVVVRLGRQRERPPTWEQGWKPREVVDATAGDGELDQILAGDGDGPARLMG